MLLDYIVAVVVMLALAVVMLACFRRAKYYKACEEKFKKLIEGDAEALATTGGEKMSVNDNEIHFNKGVAYMEKKDFDAAEFEFGRVIYTEYFNETLKVAALLNHGIACMCISIRESNSFLRQSRYVHAIGDWKQALELDPNNSRARELIETANQNRPY